ncbi:MAG: UbiA family prenyltransferase [Saprospiraceae bacterium]|nr:UbiA family prenyltransferase [Saprospiraceae bacterium]
MVICLIGAAYSVPPIQLKKHHLPAALSITLVRGLLVNLGMYLHFVFTAQPEEKYSIITLINEKLPGELFALTGFVLAFSIAIAWFKDLPDVVGDKVFKIKTFALLYSPQLAFRCGVFMVSIAYVVAIIWAYSTQNWYLLILSFPWHVHSLCKLHKLI